MKVSPPESHRRGRAHGLLAPFTSSLQFIGACLFLGLLLAATGGGHGNSPSGGGFSDEMVGTLPAFGGDSDDHLRDLYGSLFYLEGPWLLVAQLAFSASGDEAVFEQTADGELRALFPGDMRLDLRDIVFRDGELRAGLRLGAEQQAQVALILEGRLVTQSVHELRYLPLPMQRLLDSGAMRGVGLKILSRSLGGGRSLLTLSETPGSLHVVQTHVL